MTQPFQFSKYHAAGNDFIVLDYFSEQKLQHALNSAIIQKICHRQMGVGADGVVVLKSWDQQEKMLTIDLFNSDGGKTSMCANGTRCALAFLQKFYLWQNQNLIVRTLSGDYPGAIRQKEIWLSINTQKITTEVYDEKKIPTAFSYSRYFFANSGVPHSIFCVPDTESLDIAKLAPAIRFHEQFPQGCNVNFYSKIGQKEYRVRTYERGVEAETMSCGTGILALTFMLKSIDALSGEIIFHTPGGILKSDIQSDMISYGGIVTNVYTGILDPEFLYAS